MKFGKSTSEYENEPKGGSGAFIKYLRKGDNEFQIVDEYETWTWYWEHYNPGGYPFPCMEDDRANCPGCQSDVERMKKASRKVAFNAYDGQYTNVWKIPKTVAEKLKNRYDRQGTITDRPYVITQIKNDQGFYDYDIEGQAPVELDMDEISKHRGSVSDLLEQAWNDAWGDSKLAAATSNKARLAAMEDEVKEKIAEETVKTPPVDDDVPPWAAKEEPKEAEEDPVFTEAELRAMTPAKLIKLCKLENVGEVPDDLRSSADLIVDWMLETVG